MFKILKLPNRWSGTSILRPALTPGRFLAAVLTASQVSALSNSTKATSTGETWLPSLSIFGATLFAWTQRRRLSGCPSSRRRSGSLWRAFPNEPEPQALPGLPVLLPLFGLRQMTEGRASPGVRGAGRFHWLKHPVSSQPLCWLVMGVRLTSPWRISWAHQNPKTRGRLRSNFGVAVDFLF